MTVDLLARAQSGDDEAFARLIDPYRRELQVHCYRILGSLADAEDALQETLLAAWQGIAGFGGRATVRTWLYKVATSRCLLALRSARRRPQTDWPPPGLAVPEPTRMGEVSWLQPYPDALAEGLADATPGPEARYEAKEAISLAFISAVQRLPPRQRAVLILRDVLGFRAREIAAMLDTTDESVTSALKGARASIQEQLPSTPDRQPPPAPGSATEQHLVDQLTIAYETGDIDKLVALLTDDVLLTMPPIPLEYVGRELVARFLAAVIFRPGFTFRVVPTRANGQPAFGMYLREPADAIAHANGVMVFTLAGGGISGMTRFDTTVLPWFGLAPTLPG